MPGTEVAPGVHRLGSQRVNWYLLEGERGLVVVDAGLPAHWEQLVAALAALDCGLEAVEALLLTHGHVDHVGFAERLRVAADVPVRVHADDVALARGEGPGPPMGELLLNLWRPAVLALLLELARGGGTSIDPVERADPFGDGAVLEVPTTPRVVHLPGHTPGSCAFHLPDRDVLLCGDALVTVDLRTGRSRGPQLMSMFTADEERAAESLEGLGGLGEITLLPGHGDPWRGKAAEAVRLARGR